MVWEQRWHPLRREWVVVSSHRNERPWLGERVAGGDASRALPPYIQDCYLCPGNVRSSGRRNDRYTGVFVFDNDHPCVGPGAPTELTAPAGIYRNRAASGCARVVCFTPTTSPLFSNTSTCRTSSREPSSRYCACSASSRCTISSAGSRARVRSWRGD